MPRPLSPEDLVTAPSLLSPAVRNYPWGSRTAIPALLGQQPDGEPQAELWFGAHRAAPSLLADRPGRPDLAAAITADPVRELGEASLAAHGPELPFLLKLLAAERALSVQVHPTRRQAQNGHDREEAAGVPLDAPHRAFKDRNPKPELLCALEPFEALCGFRGKPAQPSCSMRWRCPNSAAGQPFFVRGLRAKPSAARCARPCALASGSCTPCPQPCPG